MAALPAAAEHLHVQVHEHEHDGDHGDEPERSPEPDAGRELLLQDGVLALEQRRVRFGTLANGVQDLVVVHERLVDGLRPLLQLPREARHLGLERLLLGLGDGLCCALVLAAPSVSESAHAHTQIGTRLDRGRGGRRRADAPQTLAQRPRCQLLFLLGRCVQHRFELVRFQLYLVHLVICSVVSGHSWLARVFELAVAPCIYRSACAH